MTVGLDYLLRACGSIAEAERRFTTLTHCTGCERLLAAELIYRRAYPMRGDGLGLVVLCEDCNTAIPVGSPADTEFRARLERMAAAAAPCGHA